MMFRLTTIIALAGFVSANSYSIGCFNTLMSIGNNPDVANCLAPNLLLPILIGAGNSADSVVAPIDSWITGMCAQPACSDDVLNGIVNNVTSGCSAEFGLPQVQATLKFVKQSYSTFRQAACLVDGQTNCITQTLKNMESAWGTMNLNDQNIAAITSGFNKGLPSSVLCTDCNKGAFTLIDTGIPGTLSDGNKAYVSKTCGADFINDGIPPGLYQSAYDPNNGNDSPTTTNYSTMTAPPLSIPTGPANPTSTTKPGGLRNGAVGGPPSTPFMNLAISGFVVMLTGIALL